MRDKINYLSISSNPYKISYSVFEGKTLKHIGYLILKYEVNGGILLEIQEKIIELIKKYNIDIILMRDFELSDYVKKDLEKLIEYQTIIHLTSLNNGVLFSRFRTYGWEKRISYTKNLSKNEKIRIINYGYGLDLTKDDVEIANSIILGEAVAHNKLQLGR